MSPFRCLLPVCRFAKDVEGFRNMFGAVIVLGPIKVRQILVDSILGQACILPFCSAVRCLLYYHFSAEHAPRPT